jgi:ethanolamine kinase
MVCLAQLGLGPPLYGRFNNGIIYGFNSGRPLTPAEMSDSHLSQRIAEKMARWHQVRVPGPVTSQLFNTLWSWLDKGK